MQPAYDAAVIGGGFFGCMIALHLRRTYSKIVVFETQYRLLGRASYSNQARLHNGYHYPRSPLTAFRSRINFPRFVSEFEDCVVNDFEKYYAVARTFSKVSARQFQRVFERIGAPVHPAPKRIRRLFDPGLIEEVFTVQEFAFDADKLSRRMATAMDQAGIEVRLGCEVLALESQPGGSIELVSRSKEALEKLSAVQVFNCTYTRLNHLLLSAGISPIPLKHELAEMALVEVPDEVRDLGITVMCGPFFSVMPFPPRGLHTLSHVRYTPHHSWRDSDANVQDPEVYLNPSTRSSNFPFMLRDASRFLPVLAKSRYVDSLWEVKTVLPASETDDSRPILIRKHYGMTNLHCILGAKIDNIYDALDEVELIARSRKVG